MGKVKIHEIAKELDLTSKEIIEKAKKLGIEVKNHMSSVEEEYAKKIKESLKTKKKVENKKEDKQEKKAKPEAPVIIRREVIVSEEELARREEEEKKRKLEEKRKEVGFIERNTNKDYNIVYRNKPSKPMTVSELFGLKTPKQEPKEEKVLPVSETEENKTISKQEEKEEQDVKQEVEANVDKDEILNNNQNKEELDNNEKGHHMANNNQDLNGDYQTNNEKNGNRLNSNPQNSDYQTGNQNSNYANNNRQNNHYQNSGYQGGSRQNGGYQNNRQGGNFQNGNYQNNRFHNNQNNGYNDRQRDNGFRRDNRLQNQNGYRQNGGFGGQNRNNFGRDNRPQNGYNQNRNGGYRNNQNGYGRRPLDEKGIEKNIKNIMTDVVEKEVVREYNKSIDKQKQNRYEENKMKKGQRSKRGGDYEINEDKLKSLKQHDRLSSMFDEQDGGMLDFYDLTTQRGKKNKKRMNKDEERVKQKIFELTEITIPDPVTVKDLAAEMKKTTADVIKKLLGYGVMATINNEVDFDTAFLIAGEFGITAVKKETVTEEDILFDETEDTENELQPRPPVVVVMGHVDHGKTSLLDAIRSTNVIEGEAGGITQHIGAYKVKINDREITFLDTPGHEAFTSMRARGAQITDIAILVVAANDGVMPQTIEAINHAKAAEIPIVVALNKIDVEGANPEKVKQELMKYELVPEEWGGDTIFVEISAKKRLNIDTLLEMVLLVADVKELKANPNKQSKGTVIEAKLDKTRGPVVSMLVQRGTLDVGDTIVVGSAIGRIRTMTDDKGKKVKKAGPSTPVEVTGLTEVPEAGDTFYEVKDEKTAKHLIERRKRQAREKSINQTARVSLNDLFSQIEKGNLKQLNIIVKADVQGSVEAVKQSLEKLTNEEVQVKVIHANVGGVTESDVTLAKVSNAIIIAFNVRPDPIAKDMANKEEVEIKQYSIIYQAIEDVEAAMKGMLDPVFEEKVIGTAEVRQTFKVSGVGTIAGAYVTDGKIARNAGIRVIRDNVVIHDGKLISLKRFKDDVKEVAYGYECGLQIEDYNDIIETDTLEVYVMEEVKK
ncbi:MAG: translation initiation factor IF-2 [Clostridia bacterium]|nr:translation initiation factor IF-2 [Clostridia bacterium]